MKKEARILQGEISIARTCGGGLDEHDRIMRINLTDVISHTVVAQISLTAHDLLMAVTGSACRPCEFELFADKVGLRCEHKIEIVTLAEGKWENRDAAATKAVKIFEVDGWKGRAKDATNHHNRVGDNQYKVVFTRYVPVQGEAK